MPALRRAAWKGELVATLLLALPLVLTNLAQIAMTVTDVMFIGHLGAQPLAASALGANLYSAIAFFALGLVSATAPMAARAEGARRNSVRDVRRTVRQGFWSAVLISVPGCLALWYGEHILILLRQPPALAALAGEYLRALLWAMPPFQGFLVLRSFMAALQQPRWAFIVAIGAILFNVLGNWALVFGNLGFPALGLICLLYTSPSPRDS